LFTYWNSNISSIFSFTGDLFNNDKDAVISFINTEKNYYTVVSNFKKTMVINPDEFSYNSGVDSLKLSYLSGKQAGPESFRSRQVYFGDVRTNGLKKLYVYSPGDSSINRIDFINRGKNIAAPRIADAGNVLSYFIKNMSLRNYHLVYTSKSINCITIRQL
jgi:hypothetical protein